MAKTLKNIENEKSTVWIWSMTRKLKAMENEKHIL
jgi:hypothetical protein